MTTDNENVGTFKSDPIGPGTPAHEAGDDAINALVHCFKQLQPHVAKNNLEYKFAAWGSSIVKEAIERMKQPAA